MKILTIFLLLFSLFSNALELGTHKYALIVNDFTVGEDIRKLVKNKQQYIYTSNVKTVGLVALFKNYTITAKSRFILNKLGVNGQSYNVLEKDGDTIKKDISLMIKTKQQKVIAKNKQVWQTKKGNVVDFLNIPLALAYDLETKPKQNSFTYQIADGKKIKTKYFIKKTTEIITIGNVKYNSIKVIEKPRGNNRLLKVWFAIDKNYLPIRILQHEPNDDIYEYVLINE
ncbi:hypothetical protein MNB_SUP05-5-354 [hydrothermal vent metagenome]|uniref:DUF3108 domain-containing protein n=1 Tax=hydrothermal vent metagenome TaxID=652676 RepID=A0A1W1BP82_9ZZZZ